MKTGRGNLLIVPTGGANLASLTDAFARLGVACEVSAEPAAYDRAERIVLPGVGAAPVARQRLAATGLAERLRRERRPVLGICLGMQILFESSAEGDAEALAVFAGRVERLARAPGVAVPNMGWSRVRRIRESRLLDGIADGGHFYFAHSYAAYPQGS